MVSGDPSPLDLHEALLLAWKVRQSVAKHACPNKSITHMLTSSVMMMCGFLKCSVSERFLFVKNHETAHAETLIFTSIYRIREKEASPKLLVLACSKCLYALPAPSDGPWTAQKLNSKWYYSANIQPAQEPPLSTIAIILDAEIRLLANGLSPGDPNLPQCFLFA